VTGIRNRERAILYSDIDIDLTHLVFDTLSEPEPIDTLSMPEPL